MALEPEGNAMGLLFLNSNAMDVTIQPTPAITFTSIGGIIEFYLFTGPSPAEVVAQYTEIVGRSQMPQYFTLGFHLSRWNYKNSTHLQEVIQSQ